MRKTRAAAIGTTCAIALLASACGGSGDSGSKDTQGGGTLKLGFVSSFSGPNGANFQQTYSAAQARFAAYKEDGGKCADTTFDLLKTDDASSPQGALAAMQKLVQQDKPYAILEVSSFFYGAAQYVTTQGKAVPVLGGAFDGAPQWQATANTNLFPFFPVPDPKATYAQIGEYLKQTGGTKVAGVAYNSPSSQVGLESTMRSAELAGLKRGYSNNTVAFGSTDVGPIVLGILQSKSDVVVLPITPDTGLAVVAGLRQAGFKGKAIVMAAGYGDLLQSPQAVQLAQGVTFTTLWAPTESKSPGTERQAKALTDHAGLKSGIPGFAMSMGWLSADLFLHGLEKAGCDASQPEFMKSLRDSNDWDADGLYPRSFDFSQSVSEELCSYYVIQKGKGYEVQNSGKPVCGKKV